jgi:hypothetical protein
LAHIHTYLYILYIGLATDRPISQAKDRAMRLTKDAFAHRLRYNNIAK